MYNLVLLFREPYILTENNNAIKHRKTALIKIAEGMSRQWFGYVLRPSNWKHQWFIIGLNTYVAYEIAKQVSKIVIKVKYYF